MFCTLFLPGDSEIVREMQDVGRRYDEHAKKNHDKPRGNPHTWLFPREVWSDPQNADGKGCASSGPSTTTPHNWHQATVDRGSEQLGKNVQTRPNVREAWTETLNANLVRGGRVRILQDQEARAHRSRSSDSGTSGGTGGIPGQTSQGTGPDQVPADSLWGRN